MLRTVVNIRDVNRAAYTAARGRAAARAPRNFLIKFTAPCGHRAIVCLKFACGYLLLCLKFAVRLRAETLQCSAGTVQEKCARDNSSKYSNSGARGKDFRRSRISGNKDSKQEKEL